MNLSSDDESSDSGTEYFRSNDKIDLKSLAFVNKSSKENFQEESKDASSDSDEDIPTYTNTELLLQIMKNLEESNKPFSTQSENDSQISKNLGINNIDGPSSEKHNDSIKNMLLQGEQKFNSSSLVESSKTFAYSNKKEPEKPVITQDNIEIVLPHSNDLIKSHKKKKQDLQDLLRNCLNKRLRSHQLLVHKVGILCWLSHGFYLNRLINDHEILAVSLSLVSPKDYPKEQTNNGYLQKITLWFKQKFQLNKYISRDAMNKSILLEALETKTVKDERELTILYVAVLRAIGIKCRLVISLCPPERILKKSKLIMPNSKEGTQEKKETKVKAKKTTKTNKLKAAKLALEDDFTPENSSQHDAQKRIEAKQKAAAILKKINCAKDMMKQNRKENKQDSQNKLKVSKKQKQKNDEKSEKDEEYMDWMESDDESVDDFQLKLQQRKCSPLKKSAKRLNSGSRKLLSSDEEETNKNDELQLGSYWAEIYVESETSWICADVLTGKINNTDEIYKRAQKPVLYVIAWNSDGLIKDVTRRYCRRWLTVTRKQRICENWWNSAIKAWKEKKDAISKAEDEQLLQRELELPLPKTISECKDHPLYVIQRHLLKYQALYPPDIVPLGYLPNGEAIYPRFCVHTLMSRQTWLKHARIVKPAQEVYKIVKSMPKYDKMTGTMCKDQNLELFGKWQTDPYIPPVAKDGIVPRNEYGNVDLFKMCMLPEGTVHINLPGMLRVAKKLNIDCAPAIVGFNFGGRGATPAVEGVVVCSEFEDILRDAWKTEQTEAAKRIKEKRKKIIYGNWKKIIKGLLIRKRLAYKYDFNENNEALKKPNLETSSAKKRKM